MFGGDSNVEWTLRDSTLVAETSTNLFFAGGSNIQSNMDNTLLSGFTDTAPSGLLINATCILDSTGELGSSASPLFIDAANHDYQLQATSAAIDQCATGTFSDFNGNPRPVGFGMTQYDIGAFEFQTSQDPDVLFADGLE